MNIDMANQLAGKLKPSDEELRALLSAHLDISDIDGLDTMKLEHYREAAAQAAVVAAAISRNETLDFDVRNWLRGNPPFSARLFFVKKLTGLDKEIGLQGD